VLGALLRQQLLDAPMPPLEPPLLARRPCAGRRLTVHHDLLQCLLPQSLVKPLDLLQRRLDLHAYAKALVCKLHATGVLVARTPVNDVAGGDPCASGCNMWHGVHEGHALGLSHSSISSCPIGVSSYLRGPSQSLSVS
jgi:hypothetical protein